MYKLTIEEAIELYKKEPNTKFVYSIDNKMCIGKIIGSYSFTSDYCVIDPYDEDFRYLDIKKVDDKELYGFYN